MLNSSVLMKAAHKRRLLPSGYVQCEWLENTTNSYMDLPNHLSEMPNFTLEYEYLIASNTGAGQTFIGTSTSNSNWFPLVHNNIGTGESIYTQNVYVGQSANLAQFPLLRTNTWSKIKIEYDQNEKKIKIGSYQLTYSGDLTRRNPIRLFAHYNYGQTARGRLKKIKIGKYEYVPCIRSSDLKPGMYDTITKYFFTNSGIGEFTFGPLSLPSGLTQSGDPYMYQGHGCVDVIINWSGRHAIYDLVTKVLTYYNE